MTTEVPPPWPIGLFCERVGGQLMPTPEFGERIAQFADEIRETLKESQDGGSECDVDCLLVFRPNPGQSGRLIETREVAQAVLWQMFDLLSDGSEEFPEEQEKSEGTVVRVWITSADSAGSQTFSAAPLQAEAANWAFMVGCRTSDEVPKFPTAGVRVSNR